MSKKLRAMECNIIIMAIMTKYGACIIFPPQTSTCYASPNHPFDFPGREQ